MILYRAMFYQLPGTQEVSFLFAFEQFTEALYKSFSNSFLFAVSENC